MNEPKIQNLIQDVLRNNYQNTASGVDALVKETSNVYIETA